MASVDGCFRVSENHGQKSCLWLKIHGWVHKWLVLDKEGMPLKKNHTQLFELELMLGENSRSGFNHSIKQSTFMSYFQFPFDYQHSFTIRRGTNIYQELPLCFGVWAMLSKWCFMQLIIIIMKLLTDLMISSGLAMVFLVSMSMHCISFFRRTYWVSWRSSRSKRPLT